MRDKEIAEIRKRFKPDTHNISHIVGCYVDSSGQIVSTFKNSITLMPEEEKEKLLATLRKTLTGAKGKNLIDIEFATQQVVSSEEHGLLMRIKDSKLNDEESTGALFEKIAASHSSEQAYVIILALDVYDVPYKSSDAMGDGDFESSDVFTYLVCSICPVKVTKPALGFSLAESDFYNSSTDPIVCAPVLGFMFPAFDDRQSNIYSALYFSKDITGRNEPFITAVFNTQMPMPPQVQQDKFIDVIESSLGDACNYELLQSVHAKAREIVELNKEMKEEDPVLMSKKVLEEVLYDCSVPKESIDYFSKNYDEQFGESVELVPKNVVDTAKFAVTTPDITVNVSADRTDLMDTKIIDGVKYLMIRLDDTVLVNGVRIID